MAKEEIIELVKTIKLKPDPNQPRTIFDEIDIAVLASTYQIQGQIHPIEVDERNIIILGERRWRAAIKAGLKEVKIIRTKGLDKSSRLERQLIDDYNRKDLSEMERAWAYATAIININLEAQGKTNRFTIREVKQLEKSNLLTLVDCPIGNINGNGRRAKSGSAELSRRLGVPQQTINTYIQLLKLSDSMKEKIGEEIPFTYGFEITRLDDEKLTKELERTIIKDSKIDSKERDKRIFRTRDNVREVVDFINKPEIVVEKKKQSTTLTDKDKLDLVTGKKTIPEIKYEKEAEALGFSMEAKARGIANDMERNKGKKREPIKPEPRKIKEQMINVFFCIEDVKISMKIQKIAIDCDLEPDDICQKIIEKWFERGYQF